MRSALLALAMLVLWTAGCDDPASAPSESPESSEFFDESLVLQGAVGLDATPCVGDGDIQIRGQLAAPFGRLAQQHSLTDILIPSAYAAPLPDEQTVANAPISLGSATEHWRPAPPTVTTTTDALGRFCLNVPQAQLDAWPPLLLQAGTSPALRRVVLDPRDVHIHVSSETVVRLLDDAQVPPTRVTRAQLLNLNTLVGTNLDLLQPVSLQPQSNIDSALQTTLHQSLEDPRIREKLAPLKPAP